VIVLSAANFPRYEVFESISQCFLGRLFCHFQGKTRQCSDVHYNSLPVTSLFLNYEPDLRGSSASVFSWGFAAQGTLLLPWRNYQQSLPKVLPLDGAQFHHFFGALLTKNR
jgi:hypothetical protein